MKKVQLFILTCCTIFISACSEEGSGTAGKALFAVPEVKSLSEIRNNVDVTGAKQTQGEGKIYVAGNYIFYIANEQGVHIFDNSNPESPENISFLNIEGVHDIAVKDNRLYADNYIDLVVFDLSNIGNITLVETVEAAFEYYPEFPADAEYYANTENVGANDLIVGYSVELRDRPDSPIFAENGDLANGPPTSGPGIVGTGGSYARFQILNEALYAVESYKLNVFNIADPDDAFFDKSIFLNMWTGGGEFETLFSQKDYLFVGATTGMYIVNAEDEFNPYFVSGFNHATACDPVVVQGNVAYITVRGGTTCGAIEDQINVIDVSDMANPFLLSTFLLDQPRGLGVLNNTLYVCSADGLKVFDASSADLQLENTYDDEVTDVIPMPTHLIAVGSNMIKQYSYGPNFTLVPISTLSF